MREDAALANVLMMGLVVAGWVGVGVAFLRRSRPGSNRGAVHRDARGWIGLALQVVGVALVWSIRRPPTSLLIGAPDRLVQVVFVLLTASLVAAAMMLFWGAFRALGPQWSVEARVRLDHELVTNGPYAYVRHPIYAGFAALIIATGLALATWMGLLAGALVYGVGTAVRIRSEEAVLRATFGNAYDAYAARVPAVVPRLRAR